MKDFIAKIHKRNMTRVLKKKQEEVDKLYQKDGLTDKVLEMQLEVNCLRNQEDIYDSNKLVFEDYVQ